MYSEKVYCRNCKHAETRGALFCGLTSKYVPDAIQEHREMTRCLDKNCPNANNDCNMFKPASWTVMLGRRLFGIKD
jgi:hypothetical protein